MLQRFLFQATPVPEQRAVSREDEDKKYTLVLLVLSFVAMATGMIVLFLSATLNSNNGTPHAGLDENLAKQNWWSLYDSTIVALHERNNLSIAPLQPATPQWEAIHWMLYSDPLVHHALSEQRLQQRYILAVLYFHFHGDQLWNLEPEHGWLDHVGAADRLTGALRWVSETPDATQPEVTVFTVPQNECEWLGVICADGNRIVGLEMNGTQTVLLGDVPLELGWLPTLQHLNMRQQMLKGSLPKMEALTHLDVHSNSLVFDTDWATELEYLDFGSNDLQGVLPYNVLGAMNKLTSLSLFGNVNLQGNFWQESLPKLPLLRMVEIGQTSLGGTLPSGDTVQNLELVSAIATPLTGTLPVSWGDLTNLVHIAVSGSTREGLIPNPPSSMESIGKSAFPTEWTHMSKLTHLELSGLGGGLAGSIPTEIGYLSNLEALYLLHNDYIKGSLPTELGKLTQLINLGFTGTHVSGSIPSELGHLSSLQVIALQHTDLTGVVPDGLCRTEKMVLFADCAPGESGAADVKCPAGCCTRCY